MSPVEPALSPATVRTNIDYAAPLVLRYGIASIVLPKPFAPKRECSMFYGLSDSGSLIS